MARVRRAEKAVSLMTPSELAKQLSALTIMLNFGEIGTNETASDRIKSILIEAANRIETAAGTGRQYDAQGYLNNHSK